MSCDDVPRARLLLQLRHRCGISGAGCSGRRSDELLSREARFSVFTRLVSCSSVAFLAQMKWYSQSFTALSDVTKASLFLVTNFESMVDVGESSRLTDSVDNGSLAQLARAQVSYFAKYDRARRSSNPEVVSSSLTVPITFAPGCLFFSWFPCGQPLQGEEMDTLSDCMDRNTDVILAFHSGDPVGLKE